MPLQPGLINTEMLFGKIPTTRNQDRHLQNKVICYIAGVFPATVRPFIG